MTQPTIDDTQLKLLHSKQGNPYRLNLDVYLCLEGGIAQILDFQRGQFYALDGLATLMVALVLEKGFEETVTYISQTYEVTVPQARADLTELLQNLANKKVIITPRKSSPLLRKLLVKLLRTTGKLLSNFFLWFLKVASSLFRRFFNPQPHPNSYTVELLLTLSWLSFRLLGWSRTIALWQQWHRPLKPVISSNTSTGSEIAQRVDDIDTMVREAAASKLFLPIVCKERSLVGYHLLRTFYGLPATLIAGSNCNPFQVHAWVEWEGKILTDDAEHCQQFKPVVRYS
jgi:hypothetical protein